MRKNLIGLFLIASFLPVPMLWAENDALKSPKSSEELTDLESSRTNTRLSALERKIVELERDVSYQNDQIRDLDRTVEDLRRRR